MQYPLSARAIILQISKLQNDRWQEGKKERRQFSSLVFLTVMQESILGQSYGNALVRIYIRSSVGGLESAPKYLASI